MYRLKASVNNVPVMNQAVDTRSEGYRLLANLLEKRDDMPYAYTLTPVAEPPTMPMHSGLLAETFWRQEAEASVRLDGETQAVEEA